MLKAFFSISYILVTIFFTACGLALLVFSVIELWHGINPFIETTMRARLNGILECIGLLTIAVAAFELGQTIYEEEVQRQAHLSAPTRVRRFISRFMVVLIVSLSIESLVAAFKFAHDDPAQLPNAAMIAFSAAALLAAWGIFIKFNRHAEELEPEAMDKVKSEDHQIEQ